MLMSRKADVRRLVFIALPLLFWLLHLAVWACWQYKWNNCLLYLETLHGLSLQYPQHTFKIGNESENQSSESQVAIVPRTHFQISPQNCSSV